MTSSVILAIAVLSTGQTDGGGTAFFEKKIRPVLVEYCYKCHSGQSKDIKGDLRIDRKLAGPDSIVTPGKPDESKLIEAIRYTNSDLQMPPDGRLPKNVIADFERWVRMGAPDPRPRNPTSVVRPRVGPIDLEQGRKFWAFQPVRQIPPPSIDNDDWSQSSIDPFILARLRDAGIKPARRAGKRTLIRRATFDLLGLPPSPEEVLTFLHDDSPDAFAKLIDRLLTSPAYGERWGRHWLDVARYADCNGADESKAFPNAYHYRNYVIDAFNRDLPYDRFIAEQIAGDLLEPVGNPAYEPLVATGFLVLGTKILAEKDVAKMGADITDEQIDTLGRAFLGLTLGCARCHDHKFDPIPTADYYALAGIFQSTRTMASPGQWLERAAHTRESLAAARVSRAELRAKKAELQQLRTEVDRALNSKSAIQIEAEKFARGNVIVDRDNYGKGIGIISDPGGQKNFVEYDIQVDIGGSYLLQLRYAAANARPGRVLLDGKVVIGRAISEKTGSWYPDGQRWLVQGSLDLRQGVNTLRLESEPLMSHIDKLRLVPLAKAGLAKRLNRLTALAKQVEEADRQSQPPIKVMAVDEGIVKNARIHKRGNHLRLGEEVPRRFLQVIAGTEQPPLPNDQSGRLQLAQWMTSAENPLTSRVMANRIWRWHFGRGLVATPDNFGAKGKRPTHPELLDYLADWLIRSGWSIKALHREIMLSSTYQMSSNYSQAPANRRDPNSIDPGNRLRWRTDRRRLEAEAIRDALLTVSGRLDRQLGNAPLSLKTYDLPTGVLEQNQIFYDTSNRRTVYLPVLRTNLYDFLTLFDFANPDLPTGHRQTTTLPTQALLLMNSPLVVDCAKQLAIKLNTEQPFKNDSARLRYAYISLFSRSPHENEEKLAFAFLEDYERTLDHIPGAQQRRLAAWAALCQTLLMSNGFVYVD